MRFRFTPILLALVAGGLLSLNLVGCSSGHSLAEVPRTSNVRSVRIDAHVETPKKIAFTDNTASVARSASWLFGISGVVVGEVIAGTSNARGRARFEPVFRRDSAALPAEAHRAFSRELLANRIFTLYTPESPRTDGIFKLRVESIGLAPGGSKGLTPTVELHAELRRPDGSKVWEEEGKVTGTPHKLEEFEAHPELFTQEMRATLQHAAHKLVQGGE